MTTLLPYFISGPPLYREGYSTSCEAISSILSGSPFPEIMLPMVDVRDLASAHIVPLIDPFLLGNNGRYLIASKGIWYSEIINLLNDNRR